MINFVLFSGINLYRCYHSAIPTELLKPRLETATKEVKIDLETIQLLERLSLVDFANIYGLQRLEVGMFCLYERRLGVIPCFACRALFSSGRF